MKTLIAAIVLSAVTAFGFDAVDAWPKTVTLDGVKYFDPPVSICVKAGYRIKKALLETPVGKQIVKIEWEQDAIDASRCKAVCWYEDIPAPAKVTPEVLTNIVVGKISFAFTTNGEPRGYEWVDKPTTNKVPK